MIQHTMLRILTVQIKIYNIFPVFYYYKYYICIYVLDFRGLAIKYRKVDSLKRTSNDTNYFGKYNIFRFYPTVDALGRTT